MQVARTNTALTPASITDQTLNAIGRAPYPDPMYKGEVSAFRVYDRALTAAEVNDVSVADAAIHAASFQQAAQTVADRVAAVTFDEAGADEDAMTSGGWLTISTRLEGGEAVAEVADTGNGIPAEHLARIYDPFFTTKPMGQGTGLGLSITYGIVREHEATIQCDSAPGKGTRFELRFIAAPDAAAASPQRQSLGT